MQNPLCPDAVFEHLSEITPARLSAMGLRGLILDLDNTLVPPHTARPTPEAIAWLDGMKAAGVRMVLLSNNSAARVALFAEGLALPYFHGAAKPLPHGFLRAARALSLPRREIAALGDQLFTDVLGARLCGFSVLLVRPMVIENTRFFRMKRALERRILKNAGHKNV